MKVTKKLLSVLLAVMMIVSSISVCFGTLAANASKNTYDADPIEYLAEALKSDTIQWIADQCYLGNGGKSGTESVNHDSNLSYTTNVELPTYEMYVEARDILIYLDMAIKGTTEFGKAKAGNTDYETRACTCSGFIETELLSALGNVSNAGKEFIEYLLYDHYATQHSKANSTESKSHDSHTTTLNIYTTDIKGYLKEVGEYTNVDASVELGYTHRIYLTEGYYQKGLFKTKYRHNYLKYDDNKAAPSEIAGKANTSIKNTVNSYVTSVNNIINEYDFDTLAGLGLSGIEGVVNQLHTLRTNIKSAVNSDSLNNYDTLFPGIDAKIAAFEVEAEKAKAIAQYADTVAEITAYQTNNPDYGVFNWGNFDEATIKADYADFMGKYGSIINDATLYAYFTKQGSISDTYVKNFRDNVVAYDLEDLKNDKVVPLYDKYALSFPMEGGEEIPFNEKQAAYSELTGYINNIKGYSNQVQNAIFPESLNAYLDLQEKLECQVSDCVVYFAENVNKDYTNVLTADVIAEIAAAKEQLAALNKLKNSVDYADNLSLLDSAFANADEFIAYLYKLLGERFTAQVAAADDVYNSINRPNSNLTIEQYSKLNALVKAIEPDIVTYLDGEGKGALVTQVTRDKYAALQNELMPAFNAFEADRGFTSFTAQDIIIRREDNPKEFFRQNENLDDDMLGEYEVKDEDVEDIIKLLEAALKDPTVAKLLGDLINKDENGNPTGEAFSLAALVTNLLNESVFTDELLNTIIQFVYPLVLKEFAKVWAGLPPSITIPGVTVSGSITADVAAGLALDDVETAIKSVGLYIGPKALASNLSNNFNKYSQVINKLNEVTIKAQYNKEKDTFRNPWEDEVLFKQATDKVTGEALYNDDGTPKMIYDLNWGINTATNKRAAFIDAAVAALSGLEPLLMALLSNKYFENPDVTDAGNVRGVKIGTGGGSASVSIFTVTLKIDPITLTLTFNANDGWDNALAPIFEALGLENIPHSEDLQTTRKLLENGLFAMIDQLISKLDSDPIEFLLNALPNLAYMIEAGMIEPLLHEIKTVINYYADAYYDASLTTGTMQNAMKSDEPININIGEMINLKDMGLDISNFKAIWNMIAGGVEILAGLEAPDAAYIASLGELVPKKTNRSVRTYTATTSNGKTLKADEAWYIKADKAAVLEYLIQWVLESGLLGGIVKNPSELVAGIFASLEENPNDAIAAIVELLNQQAYPAKQYEWFDGTIDGESVVGNSAYEIYLNPGNDWTKEKAEYLYNNIDALLTAVLTMAGTELDLGATISGAVDGLLTDKTLTSLAALLAKLDLNELLNKDKTEEEKAKALDVNTLVKTHLGLDLAAVAAKYADIAAATEANPEYVYSFGVDAGEKTFAAALAEMLAPLSVVLDYLLDGGKLTITVGNEKVELLGAKGFNNAIVPLLEALGCTIPAEGTSLEKTINALVARIDALTTGDVIKNIIDILPGVFYFITSNGLSTAVMNLLQPILTIVDTIRPVFDVMDLINNLEIGDEGAKQTISELLGGEINLKKLDLGFIFELLPVLVPAVAELDLTGVNALIYDICNNVGVEYDSASDLQETFKKGAYTENFDQADLLTVVLSFVLEWATVEDNAKKLDEMLGTNGIISALNTVFADVEITYGTPDWMYWFETEEEFNAYIADPSRINTLASIDWENIGDNDWDIETAQYFAENIDKLVDLVIAMINKDKGEDAPQTLSALLSDLVNGLVNAETVETVVGAIANLLKDIDDNLLDLAGLLLSGEEQGKVDIVGLKSYKCEAEINSVSDFINELANVLDTYAGGLVNWIFFGDDYRFAKKSDSTDTIVINGGLGYEKGLALVLEALGCELPEEANTKSVLGALATRVDAILAEPIDEVLGLLPNLVYFLNANGAGVAVSNILAPVYALLDKLAVFGLNVNLTDLIGIDLANLSLENVVTIVEDATGLPLDAAEAILVNFCTGKITKGEYIYKMSADKEDVITILLVVALELLSDDAFGAKLDEMLNKEGLAAGIKDLFKGGTPEYEAPEWDYADADGVSGDYMLEYTNNWNAETAAYVAEVLPELGDLIAGLVDSEYATLSALLKANVNVFTTANLDALVASINNLLAGIDEGLLKAAGVLLDADVVGLKAYKAPEGIETVDAFAEELANVLNKYAPGVIEWLLLGKDYKLLVKDADGIGEGLVQDGAYITISGAHGYAEGLALLLEALGCENLPAVYDVENLDTAETVKAVLASLAARINAILDNPVEEVMNLLPNLIYFLNTNGAAAVVENLLAAVTVITEKLGVFGLNIDVKSLVNIKELMGLGETDAAISLDNLSMAAVLEAVGLMVGLDLTYITEVLVGFDLGEVAEYESVSSAVGTPKKMGYGNKLEKKDMVTVLVNLVVLTITQEDNAEFVKGLVGEEAYSLIETLCVDGVLPADIQGFDWQFTEKADTGETFSAIETSEMYEDFEYGPTYTYEMAQYIADNFGEFVDNIVYLLGLDLNGDGATEKTLKDLINGLLSGSLYNSANVIAIRDALAGVLANLENLEVNGKNVGKYIVGVLKTTGLADIEAVAKVEVPEFDNDRAKFVEYLCDVLEPLYGVLKYLLADGNLEFFANPDSTDIIKIEGGKGYQYGIIPLLETLECKDIIAPADYYAAVAADGDVLITSILDTLLNRVDEILADDPAQEILDMLPNLIYFINSNGVDTVVKNTLRAVYGLLSAIKPIAEIDLYEIIGFDFATIDFEWLFSKILTIIADATGYEFEALDVNAIIELTVGTLESYDSLSGEKAYKMVYAEGTDGIDGASGGKAEMVTVIGRLLVTFIMHENNQEMLLGLLRDNLGMSGETDRFVTAALALIADCAVDTRLGMDAALSTIYYLFSAADTGVDGAVGGYDSLNDAWLEALDELRKENDFAADLIEDILGLDIFEDVLTPEGFAPNGLLAFFQKIISWFRGIVEWFKNLFN